MEVRPYDRVQSQRHTSQKTSLLLVQVGHVKAQFSNGYPFMKLYTVITPPFDPTSGGIRVMYGLYAWLLAKGQIAYLNEKLDHDSIAIYPEIIHGNPAEAQTVVRYILNKPGTMGASDGMGKFVPGPTAFAESDRLYYFSKLFGETKDVNHYLFLPILNLHLFTNQHKKRDKTAYFVGKGINTYEHPKDAILIDRKFAKDQQALADLLNECEVLWCYDPVTAMTEVARLCGCRVVMVNPVYTRDEFQVYEAGMNGISWGSDEEIPFDAEGFRSHYLWLRGLFHRKLDIFIEETQHENY